MILFSQRDNRWKDYIYSKNPPHNETIKSAGCGICTMCSVICNLTNNYIEPPKMADYAVKNGHRIDGVGTAFSLFYDMAKKYNLKLKRVYNIYEATDALSNNALVICSTNGGKTRLFSTSGHIFLMVGAKGDNVKFYDSDLYPYKYDTPYRKLRAKVKDNFIYVSKEEAKKHIQAYFVFERKDSVNKNLYSFDNTVEHLIRLKITSKDNMEHWEKCLNGKKELNKDEVRTIFDRLIAKIYNG